MHKRDLLKGLGASTGLGLLAACGNANPRKALPTPKSAGATQAVSLGIDEIAKAAFAPLKGRRVGFITNQTSLTASGIMSRRALQQGLGGDLKSLFGPEHGLDTRARAGDHVANSIDPITGLRALSLYGPTRKPTPDMLANLDVLVFEIQDIGVRSYTYISTMALAMEACGEAGKDFVVLDRPNPMGGELVQGPPMEEAFRSFVGQVPVPYRHGLTIGELAKMIVAKGWIKANPPLTVIPMQGWQRTMVWPATGLNWVPTSPNIPDATSPLYCAATGILGELRGVDIGIGTPKPFHYAAAQGVDGAALARDLGGMGFEGVTFLPYQSIVKPGYSGVELVIDPNAKTDLMALGVALICEIVRRTNSAVLRASSSGARDLFTKVYGSRALDLALEGGTRWQDLVAGWTPSLETFKAERAPYSLYR
jgi:uncharacterized protein YbbC (DUF1343 family)